MRLFFTVDLEQDCPPFRDTFRGVQEGLPRLLELFDDMEIKATFFTTGEVAKKFPESISKIVEAGHEIGCHGNSHARFDELNPEEAANEIKEATDILKKFYKVKSFRGPNLKLPSEYLKLLVKTGYRIDSTEAKHKSLSLIARKIDGITRLPVTTTSLTLRAPRWVRNFFLKRFRDPVVLFVHPWELVDFRNEKLRFDCRYKTGDETYLALKETIQFFKYRGAKFLKVEEFEL